jgi:predicted DNA-binding transcriptional regulator AlpA
MSNEDILITLQECARIAGVQRTTFYLLRRRPDFPAAVHVTAASKRYWRSELMAWLDAQRANAR